MIRLLLVLFLLNALSIQAQDTLAKKTTHKKWVLDQNSIVKDSAGHQYSYAIWSTLLKSNDYIAVAINPADDNTSFVLRRVTPEMKEKQLQKSSKPPESRFFTTGETFPSIRTRDIEGEKINTKNLLGKILVINYWFIDCPPCRKEIPELNELVKKYEKDSSVVFISMAKDSRRDLQDFIKQTPFYYKIIDAYSNADVKSFPTNVVVDREGKVAFHSSGYSSRTVFWIGKTIEALSSKQPGN
jgi:thiol-disulfide isomerase/thioredoxin